MISKNNLIILGGDTRQIHLAAYLKQKGYRVQMSAFSQATLPDNIRNYDIDDLLPENKNIILPLPVTRDEYTLNAVFSEKKLYLQDILRKITPDTTIFCGMPPKRFENALQVNGCKVIDYFKDENLTLRNALLTAEGIIGILTDQLPITVSGMHCAVVGYGRVANCTAAALKSMGASVTVFARRSTALTQALINGINSLHINELIHTVGQFDCVINTVPELIIDSAILEMSQQSCVFIEVASKPFGIDFKAADELGRRVIKAASLPGKTAPKTAGEIIGQSIHRYLTEGS